MARDCSGVIVRGFNNCFISNDVGRRMDEKEDENVEVGNGDRVCGCCGGSGSSGSMSFHPLERHRAFMECFHQILFLLRDFISSQFFT
jgi:hypothetical protein